MNLLQYENVLPGREFHEQAEYLQNANYKFQGISNHDDQLKFWFHDLSDNEFYTVEFFNIIKNLIKIDVELLRVYANGQTYGQPGYMHIDSQDANDMTLIYYANHTWKPEWGGHTVIQAEDSIASVLPKGNSAIVFPSNIPHVASEPTRHCPCLRTTVAYKLKRI